MGLTVIVGWHLHIRAAVQILQGMVPMQYNTALCLVALGMAGIGLSMRKPPLLVAGAAFAVLMGGAVTLEYLTGVSFGIDTLFFYPWERMLSADPGRMALTTAISCFLSGTALLVLAVRGDAYGVFGIINSLPLSLALTSLIGYAFQITYVLPFRLGTQMALHTAAAFFAYGAAMLGYAWKYADRGPDGLPSWASGIGIALLPVLLVGATALFPDQSWRNVLLEIGGSIGVVGLITLAVKKLITARVAYKGLVMIAVPLLLLLTFVALVVRVKHQSESAQESALHSAEVMSASQSLLTTIAETESAIRGYIITADDAFLASYRTSLGEASATTTQLIGLVADNPGQRTQARRIGELTAERTHRFTEIVRLIKEGNRTRRRTTSKA